MRGRGPLLARDSTASVAATSAEPESAGAGEGRRSAHSDPLPCWGVAGGVRSTCDPASPPNPWAPRTPLLAASQPRSPSLSGLYVEPCSRICRVSFGFRITQHVFPCFTVTGNRTFLKRNVGIQCTSFLFLTLFQLLENTKWISLGRLKSLSKSRWIWLPPSGRCTRLGEGCWSESRRSSL